MIEIEHVPHRTETVIDIVGDPEEGDEIVDQITDDRGRDYYKVKREHTVTEEKYIVHTMDGTGSEARTYTVEQNEDGDWHVAKVRENPNRGHPKVGTWNGRSQLSTRAVREALREEHGIEVIN